MQENLSVFVNQPATIISQFFTIVLLELLLEVKYAKNNNVKKV
jgi:hypothetical protein